MVAKPTDKIRSSEALIESYLVNALSPLDMSDVFFF